MWAELASGVIGGIGSLFNRDHTYRDTMKRLEEQEKAIRNKGNKDKYTQVTQKPGGQQAITGAKEIAREERGSTAGMEAMGATPNSSEGRKTKANKLITDTLGNVASKQLEYEQAVDANTQKELNDNFNAQTQAAYNNSVNQATARGNLYDSAGEILKGATAMAGAKADNKSTTDTSASADTATRLATQAQVTPSPASLFDQAEYAKPGYNIPSYDELKMNYVKLQS